LNYHCLKGWEGYFRERKSEDLPAKAVCNSCGVQGNRRVKNQGATRRKAGFILPA